MFIYNNKKTARMAVTTLQLFPSLKESFWQVSKR